MQPDIKDKAHPENTTPDPKPDPRKSKAFLAYLESVKEHNDVYRRLANS
ncbi:MAG TPA: hypothetical protein V6D12_16335 [Candidatus Obscuribacterales bacterium]